MAGMLAAALLALASLPPASRAGDAGANAVIRLDVHPLVSWTCRLGVPLPTLVTISNPHPEFRGIVEARIGDEFTAHVWQEEVSLGKGRFRLFLYPQVTADHPESPLVVRLMDEQGRRRGTESVVIRRRDQARSMLTVAAEGRRFIAQDLEPAQISIAVLSSPDLLPDRWYGYRAFDAVFWDASRPQGPSPLQAQALGDWVRSGGRLILGARKGDTSLRSPVPSLVPSLTVKGAGAPGAAGPGLMDVEEFPAKPEAWYSEKTVGLGCVVFLRADYGILSKWPKDQIVRLVSGRAADKPSADAAPNFDRPPTAGLDGMLKAAVVRMAGYQEFSLLPILAVMAAYILVVSIGDYRVLKKADRLPWTWLTFPLIIAAFSTLSYLVFYRGEIGPLVRHEIVFWDVAKDGAVKVTALPCIRNNRNRPLSVASNASRFVAAAGDSSDAYWSWREPSLRDALQERIRGDGSARITLPGHLGTYCMFREEQVKSDARALLSGDIRAQDSWIRQGTLTNHAGGAVLKAYLLQGRHIWEVDQSLRISGTPRRLDDFAAYDHRGRPYYSVDTEPRSADNDGRLFLAIAVHTADAELVTGALGPAKLGLGRPERTPWVMAGTRDVKDGIVVAFFREKAIEGGVPVERLKCVRQVVEIGGYDPFRGKE